MGFTTGPVNRDTTDAAPRPHGYRAAVIGTGFMGRVHSHAVRAAGGTVVGVAGSTPSKAEEAAVRTGAERAFADADTLIADPDVDVVHVCTPNHLHEEFSLGALGAGKHVVCEKPLTIDTASAERMERAAADSDRITAVPFVYRFHPMVREARALVRRGGLGRLVLAHGGYFQDWLLRPSENNWRVDPRIGGPLRAFGDIGSHFCDLLEFVSGHRIRSLNAQTGRINDYRGSGEEEVATEDLVTLQYATDHGLVGTAVISQVSAGRKNRLLLEISGADATLSFDQEQPELLWIGQEQQNSVRMRDPATLSPDAARLAHVPSGHPQGYQDCFNNFAADVDAATRGTAPEGLPTFVDGLRGARIADAVLASATENTWVDVP